MLEVEQKFRVVDPRSFESRLLALGGELGVPQLQSDRYFNHPAHDFAHTDEAVGVVLAGEHI